VVLLLKDEVIAKTDLYYPRVDSNLLHRLS